MAETPLFVGIDLGTTNSAAAVFDGEHVSVVRNAQGATVTPSVVRIDKQGRVTVGTRARRFIEQDPVNTAAEFKRLMGTDQQIDFPAAGVKKKPQELSAEVLKALRQDIADQLGATIERAVISVPALFELPQSSATSDAARLAGFERVELLQEPIASALAAGWRAEQDGAGTWLVFDFGGGTFDASLVRIDGTEFTVLDTAGVEALGGDDLDDVLARLFAKRMKVPFDELSPLQRELLTQHARRQKESIAAGGVRSLTVVPGDVGIKAKPCTVSVTNYFKRLDTVVAPAIDAVDRLLGGSTATAAGVSPETLDAVYLVGGSSRLPLVAKLLAARFPGLRQVMTAPVTSSPR